MPRLKVFICYRKEDAEGHAGRLYDNLNRHFRPRPKNYFRRQAEILRDVDSIKLGTDWLDYIKKVVGSCDVMIAVIGQQWLTTINKETGQRRIDDPNDVLTIELSTALSRKIPVIPCLVQGASIPKQSQLPETLKELPLRQAIELGDPDWDGKVHPLIQRLEEIEVLDHRTPFKKWRRR